MRFSTCGSIDSSSVCQPRSLPHILCHAEQLVNGRRIALGKIFLGSVFQMMHIISDRLKNSGKVDKIGGPLWFIQIWALAYFGHRLSISLITAGPMPDPLDDLTLDIHHRSLGEKLLRVASTLNRLRPEEFAFFFDLFFSYRSPPSVCYCESLSFSWPSFLCWSQPLSVSSRNLLCFCISPAVLSIGFSKKGR